MYRVFVSGQPVTLNFDGNFDESITECDLDFDYSIWASVKTFRFMHCVYFIGRPSGKDITPEILKKCSLTTSYKNFLQAGISHKCLKLSKWMAEGAKKTFREILFSFPFPISLCVVVCGGVCVWCVCVVCVGWLWWCLCVLCV